MIHLTQNQPLLPLKKKLLLFSTHLTQKKLKNQHETITASHLKQG